MKEFLLSTDMPEEQQHCCVGGVSFLNTSQINDLFGTTPRLRIDDYVTVVRTGAQ